MVPANWRLARLGAVSVNEFIDAMLVPPLRIKVSYIIQHASSRSALGEWMEKDESRPHANNDRYRSVRAALSAVTNQLQGGDKIFDLAQSCARKLRLEPAQPDPCSDTQTTGGELLTNNWNVGEVLNVNGNATLSGYVVLSINPKRPRKAGSTETVMTYGSHSGEFTHIDNGFSVTYDSNSALATYK